jgi:hypothetical protein
LIDFHFLTASGVAVDMRATSGGVGSNMAADDDADDKPDDYDDDDDDHDFWSVA